MTNNVEESSLLYSVGVLVKAGYYLINVIIFLTALILFFPNFHLSVQTRGFWILFSSFPVLLYLACLYIYCNSVVAFNGKKEFWVRTSIAFSALVHIPVLTLYRYDLAASISLGGVKFIAVPYIGYLSLLPFINHDEAPKTFIARVLGHVKLIIHDVWANQQNFSNILSRDIDVVEVQRKRESCYVDKTSTLNFQKTLSCPFTSSDHIVALMSRLQRDNLKLLDVGGAEGELTKLILTKANSKSLKISEVYMVDPVNWEIEYKTNIKSCEINAVNITQQKLEDTRIVNEYDIVLASHSLYGCSDNSSLSVEFLLQSLFTFTKENGLCIVVLASERGSSYKFKGEVLRLLLGVHVHDLSGEIFKRANLLYPSVEVRMQDDIINLTEHLAEYHSGSEGKIVEWLTYFLRYNFKSVSKAMLHKVVSMLEAHVITLDEMTESDIYSYETLHDLNVSRFSRVLPHKTITFAYFK